MVCQLSAWAVCVLMDGKEGVSMFGLHADLAVVVDRGWRANVDVVGVPMSTWLACRCRLPDMRIPRGGMMQHLAQRDFIFIKNPA